jgi:hypothetical protein
MAFGMECGARLPQDAAFCPECGTKTAGASPAQTPPLAEPIAEASVESVAKPLAVTAKADGFEIDDKGVLEKYTGAQTRALIPDGVAVIGAYAFAASMGVKAYANCENLTEVVIPGSVKEISEFAFLGCRNLTGIRIPGSVGLIFGFAFFSCMKLTEIHIPAAVTKIEPAAFGFCPGLRGITVDGANESYCAIDGVLFDKSKTTLHSFPAGKGKSYVIPQGVTKIEENAFAACDGLTELTIPDSVTHIAEDAFSHCSGLTKIHIPDSVIEIGSRAFFGCAGLVSIVIPAGAHVADDAFKECPAKVERR